MRPLVEEVEAGQGLEGLAEQVQWQVGTVLLRSSHFEIPQARYSFLAVNPFLVFHSYASRCVTESNSEKREYFGNPWHLLDSLMTRYELLDDLDLPFPLGGCFGYWGYDLKNFVEPKLRRSAENDLELPDSWIGFYSSLIVFDHRIGKTWIISTGLKEDGNRSAEHAQAELNWWKSFIEKPVVTAADPLWKRAPDIESNLSRPAFIEMVRQAQEYIRHGHIYQVNLSHRLRAAFEGSGWALFLNLLQVTPAPYSAWMNCGGFQICSASPEMFLRMSGSQIQTRPIKGTRPRAKDPTRDAQLSYELQTSSKETSELVMITDLLRNDLGRVCEFGSIQVPDLMRLERYPQVQHLVSTVEGRLRNEVTHFGAFASCFPGGSVTGAPKFRAMEIIDELEPISRGPYTGALGYLGFNRESQLSIVIRTAIRKEGRAYFNVGAGIVADSDPEAEWEETMDKGKGFIEALRLNPQSAGAAKRINS